MYYCIVCYTSKNACNYFPVLELIIRINYGEEILLTNLHYILKWIYDLLLSHLYIFTLT